MGWAKDQALKIAEEEQKLSEERKWQLHCADLIRRECPAFFEQLANQIETYVTEFNSVRMGDKVAIDRSDNSISVTKNTYPTVHISLDLVGCEIVMNTRTIEPNSEPRGNRNRMKFSVQSDGANLNLDGSNHDAIARRILLPVFNAFIPR